MTALIGGFFLGLIGKRTEEIAPEKTDGEMIDYAKKSEPRDEDEGENISSEVDEVDEHLHGENYEDPDLSKPQEVDESELPVPYEKIIGKEVTKETKQLTQKFIEVFYNLDGRYPKKYIEESQKYMTDQLYEALLENPEEPTYELFNRKYISSEIIESKKLTKKDSEKMIPYIAYIKGEVVNAEKKNKREVTDVFTIVLVKENDQYKVNDVFPNIDFQ